MVFELREGEVFLLGATSWRADEITRDRVLVTPAAGRPGKDALLARRPRGPLARVRRAHRQARRARIASLDARRRRRSCSRRSTTSTRARPTTSSRYVQDEVKAAGAVPSDRTIVLERFIDDLGDLRICLLTPFGSRVHAPWAMAALRKLRDARAGDLDAVWSDDGIVFRVPAARSRRPSSSSSRRPTRSRTSSRASSRGSSLFAARFREAAARALLLPRQRVGKRTPLWAQRKRAADLLAVASQYPSFPIVLETYRECLRDVFDLPGARRRPPRRRVAQDPRHAPSTSTTPSPFAASLLFSFVGNFIYDEDAPLAERRAHALTIDHAQLRELLGETELRKLFDADVRARARAPAPAPRSPARATPTRSTISCSGSAISRATRSPSRRRRPPPTVARRDRRSTRDVTSWIETLVRDRRIVRVRIAGRRALRRGRGRRALPRRARRRARARPPGGASSAPTKDALTSLVARYARTHGPFVAADIASRWGLGEASVITALDRLIATGKVVTGTFMPLGRAATPARGRAARLAARVLRRGGPARPQAQDARAAPQGDRAGRAPTSSRASSATGRDRRAR